MHSCQLWSPKKPHGVTSKTLKKYIFKACEVLKGIGKEKRKGHNGIYGIN